MIEGLKFKVGADELREHLRDRADHHAKRAAFKERELPKLQEVLDRVKQGRADAPEITPAAQSWLNETVGGAFISPGSHYALDGKDVLERLRADIKAHRDRADSFLFFADHTFDDGYTLTEADLRRLEFLK